MTYSDDYNIRTTQVKFNDVAEAIDGILTRNNGGTTAGSSTSYTASPIPAWSEVETGAFIIVVPHTNNGANATLNVSDTGPYPIYQGGVAVGAGKFLQGVSQLLLFNGTGWEIVAGGSLQPTLLEPLTLDTANDRVGINQTTPLTTLHIKQSSPVIRLEDTDGGYVDLSADGATGSLTIKADEAATGLNTNIAFRIDGAQRAAISNSGEFTANNVAVANGSAGVVPLSAIGAVGQTAHLLELKNSSSVNQFVVGPTGNTFCAALSATTGTFTGAVSAASGAFTGAVTGATGSFTTSVTTPTLVGNLNALSGAYEITSTSQLNLHNASNNALIFCDGIESPTYNNVDSISMTSELGNVFITADLYCDLTSNTRDIRLYTATTRDVRIPNIQTGTGLACVLEGGLNFKKGSSSLRYKKDVESLEKQYSDNILNLRPAWFRWKDPSKIYPDNWGYYGFIAEEVAEVDPRLVIWAYLPEDLDENDQPKPDAKLIPESVNYQVLPVLMLDHIKALRAEVEALKAKVG